MHVGDFSGRKAAPADSDSGKVSPIGPKHRDWIAESFLRELCGLPFGDVGDNVSRKIQPSQKGRINGFWQADDL